MYRFGGSPPSHHVVNQVVVVKPHDGEQRERAEHGLLHESSRLLHALPSTRKPLLIACSLRFAVTQLGFSTHSNPRHIPMKTK
jgi:hypothetical protein